MYQPLGSHSPLVAAVRDLRTKKGRREQARYAVEGPTLLAEAIESGLQPAAVFGTDPALEGAAALLARVSCPVYSVAPAVMAKMSDLDSPPGLVATLPLPVMRLEATLNDDAVLLLAGVSDPGNAGTLLRTAEIFGIRSAVFAGSAVEPFNPKVVRSAMGATFRMNLAVSEGAAAVSAARAAGFRVVAAGHGGQPLPGFTFPARCMLAIGNERRGVLEAVSDPDDIVTIPQSGLGESLNAAVAGGIVLYAFSLREIGPLSSLGGHFGA